MKLGESLGLTVLPKHLSTAGLREGLLRCRQGDFPPTCPSIERSYRQFMDCGLQLLGEIWDQLENANPAMTLLSRPAQHQATSNELDCHLGVSVDGAFQLAVPLMRSSLQVNEKDLGLCAFRHAIPISMEAILACHPARSTE